MEGRWMD